jgi:hypothetical protein
MEIDASIKSSFLNPSDSALVKEELEHFLEFMGGEEEDDVPTPMAKGGVHSPPKSSKPRTS